MKLSIAIIVLATIIYGCQCAPYPDWREDFNQQMQNLRNRLHEDQERRNQALEAARLQREEYMRQLHERLEAQRLEREENMRQFQARLEAQRLEREEYMRRWNKQLETASQNRNGVSTSFHNSYSLNGGHTYHRVDERITNNVREQIVTDYTSASGKTEIKKYKCDININSPCVLDTIEVKDGPPEDFYYSS